MKRNLDLIRKILLRIYLGDEFDDEFYGYDADAVHYNLFLLVKDRWITREFAGGEPNGFTDTGHYEWKLTKKGALCARAMQNEGAWQLIMSDVWRSVRSTSIDQIIVQLQARESAIKQELKEFDEKVNKPK